MAPAALTIAGSDSGGGAGIQADLKTFAALGVYGASAITALTAQNTMGVQGIHVAPPEFFARQLRSVLDDIRLDAAKTGMLANREIILALDDVLRERPLANLVVDPVMVSKHGAKLLEDDAIEALVAYVLPRAFIVTPNAEEAALLAGAPVADREDMRRAARRIHELGPRYVLVKGGHAAEAEALDILYDGERFVEFSEPRADTPHTHGTGCTLSAAIAAGLAKGLAVEAAVAEAKRYITGAIAHAEPIGRGISPVNHLWEMRGRR